MFLPITLVSGGIIPAGGAHVPVVAEFSSEGTIIRFRCDAFVVFDKVTNQTRIALQAVDAFLPDQAPIPLNRVYGFDKDKMMGFAGTRLKTPFFETIFRPRARYALASGQSGFLEIGTPPGLGISAAALQQAQ
jgi:hypothetical protein